MFSFQCESYMSVRQCLFSRTFKIDVSYYNCCMNYIGIQYFVMFTWTFYFLIKVIFYNFIIYSRGNLCMFSYWTRYYNTLIYRIIFYYILQGVFDLHITEMIFMVSKIVIFLRIFQVRLTKNSFSRGLLINVYVKWK